MAFLGTIAAGAASKMLGPALLGLGGVAAGVALGIAYEHKAPWGPFPKLASATAAAAAWKSTAAQDAALAKAWAADFGTSEAARNAEHVQAVADVGDVQTQCLAQVAEARRSASAIQSLVTKEPSYDAKNCPVRSLVDPGQLRNAVGPSAAAGG